jgi:hypothetical protein
MDRHTAIINSCPLVVTMALNNIRNSVIQSQLMNCLFIIPLAVFLVAAGVYLIGIIPIILRTIGNKGVGVYIDIAQRKDSGLVGKM